MKKLEFLTLVREEIENIKTHATPEEISNLDFNKFNPTIISQCIYGQMTGCCFSDRARELQPKIYNTDLTCIGDTFRYIKYLLVKGEIQDYKDYTTLEMYIPMKGAKNKQIIQYLKGERKTLTL